MTELEIRNQELSKYLADYGITLPPYATTEEIVQLFNNRKVTEEEAAYAATLSGEQHLANVARLTHLIYHEELKQPMDKTLHFGKAYWND